MLQKYRDTETQIRNNQLNTGQFWGLRAKYIQNTNT